MLGLIYILELEKTRKNQRTFYLRSGWRDSSLSGLLTVKGTGMREQGSLKGEGTHRGNLCVEIFKPNMP